jgi:hypothetical protein
MISWNIISGSVVVKPILLAFLITSCSCSIAVSESPTHYFAIATFLNIILHPFHFLFVAEDMYFLSSLHSLLLFGMQVAQCPKGSYSFCFRAALSFIHLMTSLCGMLCRHAIFAHWMQQNLLVWSINHCCFTWRCCAVRCRMLEDTNDMKETCIFNVKLYPVGEYEQSIVCDWTITNIGRVMLTAKHHSVFTGGFRWDAWDFVRQTSPDVLSMEELRDDYCQSRDFDGQEPLLLPVNKEITLDRLTANCWTV